MSHSKKLKKTHSSFELFNIGNFFSLCCTGIRNATEQELHGNFPTAAFRTNHDMVTRVFPRFSQFSCVYLQFFQALFLSFGSVAIVIALLLV